MSIGVLLVGSNALRPISGATAADLVFVVALIAVAVTFLDSDWGIREIVPTWLIASGILLLSAALLVGIFPAPQSEAELLFPGRLFHGGPILEQPILSNGGAAIRLVGALMVVPLLIAAVANSARRIQLLADLWIAGVGAGALLGTLAYLGVGSFAQLAGEPSGFQEADIPRVVGLTTHSNHFALVSAMALPVAAMRLGQSHGRARLYFSAVVLVLISAIAISGSRSGLIAGCVGLVVLAVMRQDGRKAFARTVAVGAILGIVSASALSPPPALERLLDPDVGTQQSTESREAVYHAVWQEVVQRPVVGHGFQYIRGSHNIYLQLLHAGGLIALTGFLAFALGSTAIGLRLGSRDTVPDGLQSLARASVASLAVWLIAVAMVGNQIFDRYLYIPAGLIIAIWTLEKKTQITFPREINKA